LTPSQATNRGIPGAQMVFVEPFKGITTERRSIWGWQNRPKGCCRCYEIFFWI